MKKCGAGRAQPAGGDPGGGEGLANLTMPPKVYPKFALPEKNRPSSSARVAYLRELAAWF